MIPHKPHGRGRLKLQPVHWSVLAALLAHGALLWLAVDRNTRFNPSPVSQDLLVTLEPQPRTQDTEPQPEPDRDMIPPDAQSDHPSPDETIESATPVTATELSAQATTEEQKETADPPPANPVNIIVSDVKQAVIAEIVERASTRDEAVALGSFRVTQPANWTRRVAIAEETPFAEHWLPASTVILDEWENPDGSREVKIRTPQGHTLCGRRAAAEPMERLVEAIMLFQKC